MHGVPRNPRLRASCHGPTAPSVTLGTWHRGGGLRHALLIACVLANPQPSLAAVAVMAAAVPLFRYVALQACARLAATVRFPQFDWPLHGQSGRPLRVYSVEKRHP